MRSACTVDVGAMKIASSRDNAFHVGHELAERLAHAVRPVGGDHGSGSERRRRPTGSCAGARTSRFHEASGLAMKVNPPAVEVGDLLGAVLEDDVRRPTHTWS